MSDSYLAPAPAPRQLDIIADTILSPTSALFVNQSAAPKWQPFVNQDRKQEWQPFVNQTEKDRPAAPPAQNLAAEALQRGWDPHQHLPVRARRPQQLHAENTRQAG
jgi:hypothetical protein